MAESDGKLRILLITFFPMLIATLSLVTSIFNGYLNNKFVDLIQRNFGRAEYMRTCKETIDAAAAVNKFAALGTYLANLRDEAIRARYTELVRGLEKAVADAGRTPAAELGGLFEGPDRIF